MSQKTILIVTNSDDAHADLVYRRLTERTVPVYRLDSDRLVAEPHVWRISAQPDVPTSNSWVVPEVEVVWHRKIFFPEGMDVVQSFLRQELEGILESILAQYRQCRWINPQDRLTEARSKIAQLQLAKLLGFRIPDTLATTSPDLLKEFANLHGGEIIAKPIRSQVIGTGQDALVTGTRRLTPEYYAAAVAGAPCYAQERLLIRAEIRVVVFGTQMFAFRLTPDRRVDDIKQLPLNSIRHEPCTLEPAIARKIESLMSRYGLAFGAIDLAVVDDGEPVFLELNPNGQWLWLEMMTGVNLLDPFIDFLLV
jgi:glutathione synthase/RimK-type ligase-like ATP-grasp enzyme